MNQELKPCPFCGASEEELMLFCDPDEGRDNSGPSRRIQCAVCHIEAPFYPTEDDAIAAWNKRAPALESRLSDPDALAREIAANAYASAGNPLVARLVRNGQADHMPGFIAALAALEGGVTVTDEMVERCAEIARGHLEIDCDNEGPFIRFDSIDAALRAVLKAALSAPAQRVEEARGLRLERDLLLKAILYYYGPEGAQKITTAVLAEREKALAASPAPAPHAGVKELFPNVDRWGAREWFDRLIYAVQKHDEFRRNGDDFQADTYKNIASSSGFCLAREHAAEIRTALQQSGGPDA